MPVYTLADIATHREEIRKSRFLALAAPVTTPDAAMAFIATHADATASHNCWAWRIGSVYRFHDAGEPGGTAGRPILAAIDGQECDRVAVVVTRWFGGILLGAGGLMRAYGGCAATCLRLANRVPIVEAIVVTMACTFAEMPVLRARLRDHAANLESEDFTGDGAVWRVRLPRERALAWAAMVSDVTRGRVQLAEQIKRVD
ncbi:IMPACT family protein [Pigmentiphaga litoralis]|uniref:IMPACT family protein n=1 Tax=Pigmentiphaga litoralis TaxID=516702 RepID=UPI003B434AF5